MNPSTALAQVLVDELIRGGVREAVLAPGSRSAPLAYALHAADAAGRLRLHVRIDERSAAFLALGLAKASGTAVPVVTTSGTAAANLHPAVLEASHAGVPLLLLTADRPPELRGRGANQTIDQLGLFGTGVRLFVEVGVPETRTGQNAAWRAMAGRALAAASGDAGSAPGPVHLNLALRDPLVPGEGEWPEPLDGRPGDAPWTARVPAAAAVVADDLPARTLVVLGDGAAPHAEPVLSLAAARGWPVVAEPTSGFTAPEHLVGVPDLVLADPDFLAAHPPDRVLVVGRPTLTRAVGRLVAGSPADVVAAHGWWPDPASSAGRVLPGVPSVTADLPLPLEPVAASVVSTVRDALASGAAPADPAWLPSWVAAGNAARAAASTVLVEALNREEVDHALPSVPEPFVAARTLAAVPEGGLLVVGSSKPIRDLALQAPRPKVRVLANRGVAGIDGTVSTAVGAALAHQAGGGGAAYALLGDLTFLHDANGLVLGPDEPRPDLTIVVVNNNGGAIFGTLEQGTPELADAYERIFGTPHDVDLAALCAATGTGFVRPGTVEELDAALVPTAGLRVVEVQTDRVAAVALAARMQAAVRAALA